MVSADLCTGHVRHQKKHPRHGLGGALRWFQAVGHRPLSSASRDSLEYLELQSVISKGTMPPLSS